MKRIDFVLTLVLALVLNSCDTKNQQSYEGGSSDSEVDYFGEEPPGLTPKLFAPEILSPEGLFEGGGYSPDRTEYYFTRKNGKYKERTFFVIRYENGEWGNESETDLKWPKFSKGGDTLY